MVDLPLPAAAWELKSIRSEPGGGVGAGVDVGVTGGVAVAVAVAVGVGVAAGVGVGVAVGVGGAVGPGVGVAGGVAVAVAVGVGVPVGPGGVGVAVAVGVGVAVAVAVGVGAGVAVAVAVGVAAGVGDGVGPANALIAQRAIAVAEAMAGRCRIIEILEQEERELAMDRLHLKGDHRRTVIEEPLSHRRGDLVKIPPREAAPESPANSCVTRSRISASGRKLPVASQERVPFGQGC
jgi:hypothetical protein